MNIMHRALFATVLLFVVPALANQAVFRMHASLDRKRNLLTVQGSGIRVIRLYVIAGMFDRSKPVILRYGSRLWRGEIPVSAECMLRHYAATRDATAPVCNEVDLNLFGGVNVRFRKN